MEYRSITPTVWAIHFRYGIGLPIFTTEKGVFSLNKLKNMSESSFLKLFMAFMSACFIAGAFCMPDRGSMISGLWTILSSPAKISTNYFDLGGYADLSFAEFDRQ